VASAAAAAAVAPDDVSEMPAGATATASDPVAKQFGPQPKQSLGQ